MGEQLVNIWKDDNNLYVVFQLDNDKREQFGFPLGEGWELKNDRGELNAVAHARRKLVERKKKQLKSLLTDQNLDDLKAEYVGQTYDTDSEAQTEIAQE